MKILALLNALLCFGLGSGFSQLLTNAQTRKSGCKEFSAASSDLDTPERPETTKSASTNRREALTSLLLLSSARIMVAASSARQSPSTEATNIRTIGSVDQALNVIESECDRRFLHAVVASDYKLMYRELDSRYPVVVEGESSDFDTADFSLEKVMANGPIQPSNAFVANTSPDMVNANEVGAASIWPLGDDVHFAWSEDGGPLSTSASKMIVDGIDCGRMSLEDALESKDRQVMFRADKYLAIPVTMEKDLIAGLRNAFII